MIEQYLRGKLSPAAENKAEQFEHKKINYNEDNEKKTKPKEQPKKTVGEDSVSEERVSVFHHFGTHALDSINNEIRKAGEERKEQQRKAKEELEKKHAEDIKKKEEQAREKLEIRQKAEIARQKAAEIRRNEDEQKERKRRIYKKKQKKALDEAVKTDWLIRQMKQKLEQ